MVVAVGVVGAMIVGAVVLLLPRSITPTDAMAPPRFVDVSSEAGIDQSYEGDWRYFAGGGVAAFDCDQDSMPDL